MTFGILSDQESAELHEHGALREAIDNGRVFCGSQCDLDMFTLVLVAVSVSLALCLSWFFFVNLPKLVAVSLGLCFICVSQVGAFVFLLFPFASSFVGRGGGIRACLQFLFSTFGSPFLILSLGLCVGVHPSLTFVFHLSLVSPTSELAAVRILDILIMRHVKHYGGVGGVGG